MKRFFLKASVLCFLLFIAVLTSCSDNEDNSTVNMQSQDQDISEMILSSDMDVVTASIEDYMIETYENQEDEEARGEAGSSKLMPECATVTIDAEQNFRELTIDFSSQGCVIRGHLYRGQIVLTYTRDIDAEEISLSYVLNNFYFDNKQVSGSNTILKTLSNVNGNPQFTHTVNLTVTWPNGVEATRDGQIVREWVEGFGSGVFTDNVFEVTGYWASGFVNGNTHNYEIVTPLRREMTCYYFVSGVLSVERTLFSGELDYGDGNCDNQAAFTFESGTVINIFI